MGDEDVFNQLAEYVDDGGCAFAAGPPDLQDDFNIPCESSAVNYLEDYCSLPVKARMSLIENKKTNPNKKITSKETVLANGQTSAFPNFGRCSAESSSSSRLIAGGVTPSDCSGGPSRSGKDSKDEAFANSRHSPKIGLCSFEFAEEKRPSKGHSLSTGSNNLKKRTRACNDTSEIKRVGLMKAVLQTARASTFESRLAGSKYAQRHMFTSEQIHEAKAKLFGTNGRVCSVGGSSHLLAVGDKKHGDDDDHKPEHDEF